MKKCLRIAIAMPHPAQLVSDLQKKGSKLGVEGTVQFLATEKELKIIVCGLKEQVDQFVDLVHKEAALAGVADINIEPFVKTKDYRGAFRIIE